MPQCAAQPLSALLESVDTPVGRQRLTAFLGSQPFPHYEPHPDRPGLLVRIDADGRRTTGRFVNRQFRPAEATAKYTISKKAAPCAAADPRSASGQGGVGRRRSARRCPTNAPF
jgi:hypothetical protein